MKLNFFQVWYDDNSKPTPSSRIKAYDCRNNPEFDKREVAHLIRFYDDIVCHANDDEYFALLSPKFSDKTGLSIEAVESFILENPQHDIYLFNPFPATVYIDFNVWDNAESRHPGLKRLTQELFDTAKVDFNINSLHRNNISNTVYCNYWVASKIFLDEFVSFVRTLDSAIDGMTESKRAQYFSRTRYNTEASFYPFIFERMINTFLLMNSNYSSKPYIYDYPFPGNHKLTHLESDFYFSENRTYFDQWEASTGDIELIYEGFKIVQNRLKPNVQRYKQEPLNRLSNSVLKRLYKISSFDLTGQLERLEKNPQ